VLSAVRLTLARVASRDEALSHISGFSRALYKRFAMRWEAEEYLRSYGPAAPLAVKPEIPEQAGLLQLEAAQADSTKRPRECDADLPPLEDASGKRARVDEVNSLADEFNRGTRACRRYELIHAALEIDQFSGRDCPHVKQTDDLTFNWALRRADRNLRLAAQEFLASSPPEDPPPRPERTEEDKSPPESTLLVVVGQVAEESRWGRFAAGEFPFTKKDFQDANRESFAFKRCNFVGSVDEKMPTWSKIKARVIEWGLAGKLTPSASDPTFRETVARHGQAPLHIFHNYIR
jgi:hypothetical protein